MLVNLDKYNKGKEEKMPKKRSNPSSSATETQTDFHQCDCCDPKNNLVMRPDLGIVTGDIAKIAVCVLHQPISVYVWNNGKYELKENLELKNNQIVNKETGAPFQEPGPRSIIDLEKDDEVVKIKNQESDGGAAPNTNPENHVNLENDEYY